MILQYTPYVPLQIITGGICIMIGVYCSTRKRIPGSQVFSLLMFALALWLLGSIIESVCIPVDLKYLGNIIAYPGIVLVPVGWLLFILSYTGRDSWIQGREIILLLIIPTVVVSLVITNPLHHLYYSSVSTFLSGGYTFISYQFGPLFWLNVSYSYLLMVIGVGLIFLEFLNTSPMYRKQNLILLLVCGIPFFVNGLHVSRIGPLHGFDLTPFAFLISSIGILIGTTYFQFLKVAPIAHRLCIRSMRDGIIVTDISDRIVDANPSACAHLNHPEENYIGEKITDVFPEQIFTNPCNPPEDPGKMTVINLPDRKGERYYERSQMPVKNSGGYQIGDLILIHDAHERIISTRALNKATQKLQLLSSITRHDIKNQLMVLLAYIAMAEEENLPENKDAFLKKMEQITRTIDEQINFTSDYQELGLNEPRWQNVYDLMEKVSAKFPRDIRFINRLQDLSIFADPMLRLVLYNLFDNATRHGGGVTTIEAGYLGEDDHLVWYIVDDGRGIPPQKKEIIFRKGYGENTGFGLFLVREILSITECTISENGTDGARFEIRVPKGLFRIITSHQDTKEKEPPYKQDDFS